MKKIICIAFAFISCSDIEQSIILKDKKIIGCYCKDGTYQIWRKDIAIETNNISAFPCSNNGGIKSYVYQ